MNWLLKKLEYPIMDYQYNCYYNLSNNSKIVTKTYKVSVPIFTWRIVKDNTKSIQLHGLLIEKDNLNALFRNDYVNMELDTVKNICLESPLVISKVNNSLKEYNIYCNSVPKGLKPFRIYWIKDKIFLYMNDYNKKYKDVYDELISKIELK